MLKTMKSNTKNNENENEMILTKFNSFLFKRKSVKGTKITHTKMSKPRGSFTITKKDDINILYKYINILNKKQIKYNLIERHCDFGPFVIDLDFKYDTDEIKRYYTEEDVYNIVKLYKDCIDDMFNIENDKKIAYVFERDGPYISRKILKDGIHIVFPHIISVPEYQYIIRQKILKLIPKTLNHLKGKLKNSWADVVDRSVIKSNGWLMYGASKPGSDAYKLKYIYNNEMKLQSLDKEIDYVELLSIRNKEHDISMIKEEKLEEIEKYNERKTKYKRIRKKKKMVVYDFETIKEYVDCLKVERAENERTWKEVGWCLYNIDSSIQMLGLWKYFSSKADNYDETGCDTYWKAKYADTYNEITIGSLKYWAKNDNEEKFNEIKKKNLSTLVDKSADNTNNSVAKVLSFIYNDTFKCVVHEKKILWYEFTNHKWLSSNQGLSLKQKISNELSEVYFKRMSYLNGLDEEEENELDVVELQDNFCKLVTKLKETSFKNNVMVECREEFNDTEFDCKLNQNLFLLGLENGVYDLKNMEFRKGRPDDYISLSTSASYIKYDEEDETIQEVYNFFDKIFVDKELKHYVLKILASCLDGVHHDDMFVILTGSGSNGKSMLLDLINKTFGELVTKWPISLLTQKRQKGESASPQLIGARYSRFVYMDEPDAGTDFKLNSGMVKEYTGGDFISGRNMYDSNIIKFQPQFMLFLLCNDIPQVPGTDNAIWRRNRVIPCLSKFVEDPILKPDPTHPLHLQFKKDKKLKIKMNDWVDAFMSILIHYYGIFKKEGYNDKFSNDLPYLVKNALSEYSKECDIYSGFISIYLTKSNNNNKLKINIIYEKFKEWFEENYSGEKSPHKQEFKKYLTSKYGKKCVKSNYMIGYILENIDEE